MSDSSGQLAGYDWKGLQLLSIFDVMQLTTLARPTIYKMMDRGDFPKALRVLGDRIAWRQRDIAEWIECLPENDPKAEKGAMVAMLQAAQQRYRDEQERKRMDHGRQRAEDPYKRGIRLIDEAVKELKSPPPSPPAPTNDTPGAKRRGRPPKNGKPVTVPGVTS